MLLEREKKEEAMLRIQGFNPSLNLNCSQRNTDIERNIGNTQPETDNMHFKSIQNLNPIEQKAFALATDFLIKGNRALSTENGATVSQKCHRIAMELFGKALMSVEALPDDFSRKSGLKILSMIKFAHTAETLPSTGKEALTNCLAALNVYTDLLKMTEKGTLAHEFAVESRLRVLAKIEGLNIPEMSIFA